MLGKENAAERRQDLTVMLHQANRLCRLFPKVLDRHLASCVWTVGKCCTYLC